VLHFSIVIGWACSSISLVPFHISMMPFLPSRLPDASNPIKPMERAYRWCKASTREQWQHLLLRGTGGHHLLSTNQVIAASPFVTDLAVEKSWWWRNLGSVWRWRYVGSGWRSHRRRLLGYWGRWRRVFYWTQSRELTRSGGGGTSPEVEVRPPSTSDNG
jgi:hypothetical protein